MTMQILEKDGIVVDNADPLGIGRVRVFVYGVHDITGVKTPYENLPWAYPSQSIFAIPTVWSSVRIKHRFTFGKSPLSALMDQDSMEYYSPKPFIKLALDKDPRRIMTWDPTVQQWLKDNPVSDDDIRAKKKKLEEDRDFKERQLLALKDLYNSTLEQESEALKLIESNTVEERQKELKELKSKKWDLDYQLTSTIVSYTQRAQITYPNRSTDDKDLTYQEYENKILADVYERYDKDIEPIESRITQLESEIQNFSEVEKGNAAVQKSFEEKKSGVLQEIEKVSNELVALDKEILYLDSVGSEGARAVSKWTDAQKMDARLSDATFDTKSSKVFDSQGRLIGNWTGTYFFLPGFLFQPGPPIYERQLAGRLKLASHIMARDGNYSVSGDRSTIIDPSDSGAIKKSNEDKTFSCDLSDETKLKILTKKQAVLSAVRWLRDQIASLFSLDSNSALAQSIRAAVKQLTALLKSIQKFLTVVNDIILEIAKITAKIRQMINWILSLPARLLALLQECLTHFFNSLSDAFSDSLSTSIPGSTNSFTEVSDLIKQAKSTYETATETVQSTVAVYTEAKAIEATFEKV